MTQADPASDVADLQSRLADAEAAVGQARAGRDSLERERDDLKGHLSRLAAEADEARQALASVVAERDALKEHLKREAAAAGLAQVERDRLASQLRALTPEDAGTPTTGWRAPAPRAAPPVAPGPEDVEMHITTGMDPGELRSRLASWSPWRVQIYFSNGVKTSDLDTKQPFTLQPLTKMKLIEGVIPFAELGGGQALDIGFNAGYNSFYLADKHGMRVDGIDVETRHLEVARFIAEIGGLPDVEFMLADAQTFSRPERYDLVLHLGTLYHLPNPVQSLAGTAGNLRPGGYLALETTCYRGSDPRLVKYIRGYFGDTSNYWALSTTVLEELLEINGFTDVVLVHEVPMADLDPGLSRVIYAARRAGG